MRKTNLFLPLVLVTVSGCGQLNKKNVSNDTDTTYETIRNFSGDTIFAKPIVKGKANGIARYYYDDGKLNASTEFVNDMINGKSITYTKEGEVASIEIWKNNALESKVVYWQELPDQKGKFIFLSKEGIYTVKNGNYIYDFGPTPPDGLMIQKYGKGQEVYYVYKNGKLELY